MPDIILSMSMSLDGFVASTNISKANPLGDDGLRLHKWLFDAKTPDDERAIGTVTETSGAVIVGWRTYIDAVHDAWNDTNPFAIPAFIICQEQPEEKDKLEGFTFATDGIEAALVQAKEVAGDKNVWVMGGASIAQQYLKAGLITRIDLHIAPVIFNKGLRLFDNLGDQHIELEPLQTVQTSQATHISYRVIQ